MEDNQTDMLIAKYIAIKSNILIDIPDVKFCSNNGIIMADLERLKSLYPDWANKALTARRNTYAEGTINVDNAIYRAAKIGDVRAAELWYKRFDNYDPRKPQGDGPTDGDRKTWAELLIESGRNKRKAKKKEMIDNDQSEEDTGASTLGT